MKLPLFLSYSGPASEVVAKALNRFLPQLIRDVEPWCAPVHVEQGTLWMQQIASGLRNARAAILCVTRVNRFSHWLHFEAGALSIGLGVRNVTPYLIDLPRNELYQPLGDFQSVLATSEDTLRLCLALKGLCADPLSEDVFVRLFDSLWGELKTAIDTATDMIRTTPVELGVDDVEGWKSMYEELRKKVEMTVPDTDVALSPVRGLEGERRSSMPRRPRR